MSRELSAKRLFLPCKVHMARHWSGDGHQGRQLRHPKRYRVVNSCLTAMHWWRVMLDEAQNVGGGFSQVLALFTC